MAGVSVANLAADLVAFAIVSGSLYFIGSQASTEYLYQKADLLGAYLLFEILFFVEVVRNVFFDPGYLQIYPIIAATCVLWAVVLLTYAAYAIYARPGGKTLVERLRSMYWRWPHGLILAGFLVFIILLDGYVLLYRPYTLVQLTSIDGASVTYPVFNSTFLLSSLIVLAFFAYPSALLLHEARRTKVEPTRRALTVFPLCWIGIGATLLFFQGYLIAKGYDYIGIGYVIISVLIGVTATLFRKTSVLSSFFDPMEVDRTSASASAGTGTLDVNAPVLLVVDPSAGFETALAGVARDKVAAGDLVYVFTSKGSPLHYTMGGIPGVRFYLMASNVSYATPSDKANELLIPQNEPSAILDMLDKTISTARKAPITFIFDSISDMALLIGIEDTYKFLKQAEQILVPPNLTCIYLLTAGAQDDRTVSLVKSLFRLHAVLDQQGIRMTKGPEPPKGSEEK